MKMEVQRYEIEIIPENDTDIAYLEEVLGFRDNNSIAICKRENAIGLDCLAYIVIRRQEEDAPILYKE